MRWEAELDGTDWILDHLSRSATGPEVEVSRRADGRFVLRSDSFNSVQEAREVKELADEIVKQINGASLLSLGKLGNVEVGGIRALRNDGSPAAT